VGSSTCGPNCASAEQGTLIHYDPATGAKEWEPHTGDRLDVKIGQAAEAGLRHRKARAKKRAA
jgi:hypothetical protein